jgi:Gram-negative bacterial TonB protein C-terminal
MVAATYACAWKNMNAKDQELIELLQRWQAGNFTRADEAALRRLRAEGDAFTQEAIDGYFAEPEADQTQVLTRFRQQIPVEPLVKPIRSKFQWWAAAAALVVLLAAIWAILPQESQHIALEKSPSPALPEATAPPAPPADIPNRSTAPLENKVASPDPSKPITPAAKPQIQQDERIADAPAATAQNNQTLSAPPVESSPIAGDMARIESRSAAEEAVTAAPEPKESEVVLRKSEQVRKAKTTPLPPGGPAGNAANAPELAAPRSGWERFNREVAREARLTPQARAAGITTGKVQLRFNINDKGYVTELEVLQPLGYGCDQMAMDIVRQYRWTGSTGQVTIPFQ